MTAPRGSTMVFFAAAVVDVMGTDPGDAVADPSAGAVAISAAPAARFAVIVGVNDSVDKGTPALRYADDDAAGYLDLFRTLGARTYLLSRFDENTQRLHPQAAAEAHDPRIGSFVQVMTQVAADVAKAHARHVPTVLYFIYAGHGNVENERGYLALEDSRLFGSDLERLVLDPIRADEAHIIVDACYSVFLALSRSPGGQREDVHGFSTLGGLGSRSDVGLLLSTSSARESHEWSEFQAGIFSHEVRSGLLGAADANRDGHISYREIAAFIDRANEMVPNEKFRPDVYVKEPSTTSDLVDLSPGMRHRLELGGDHPGHYSLEDARGVRLADFHNAAGQALNLIRIASAGPLFLRRAGDADEYVVDAAADILRFESLRPQESTAQPRGAAHVSFSLLFALPFSQQEVDRFVVRKTQIAPAAPRGSWSMSLRRPLGGTLLGVGVAAGIGATWAVLSAWNLQHANVKSNQAQRFETNQSIERRNTWARMLYGAGGAAMGAGALLLLWPSLTESNLPPVMVGITPDGPSFGTRISF